MASNTRSRKIHISNDMKREEDKVLRYEKTDEYRFSSGRNFKRGTNRGVYNLLLVPSQFQLDFSESDNSLYVPLIY